MKKTYSIPISQYTIEDYEKKDLIKVKLNICHEGANPNGSFFEPSSLVKAQDSIKNKPIIAAYEINEDGEKQDFKGHEVEYKIISENGNIEFKEIYIEQPIGAIPESCDYSIEEIDGQQWVTATGYLYNIYCSDAVEIIKQNQNRKKLSMEINVIDGFDGDDGFYHITEFEYLGITLLGDENLYPPAMGSNAEISLFTKAEQTKDFSMKFSEILEAINKKGGNEMGAKTVKKDFSMSVEDLKSRLREKLKENTYEYTYSWGEVENYPMYYFQDVIPEENLIIAESSQDWGKFYGIPYSLEGDEATLNFDEATRYVRGDWRKFEGKEEPTSESKEYFSSIINKETEHYQKEIEEVKKSFVATETEEYKTLKAEFEKVENDKKALEEFKAEFEKKERNRKETELFEKFKDLETIEGFAEIKNKASEFSLEDLEKEFYVLIGKKNFSMKKNVKEKDDTVSLKLEGDEGKNELSEAEKRYGKGIK